MHKGTKELVGLLCDDYRIDAGKAFRDLMDGILHQIFAANGFDEQAKLYQKPSAFTQDLIKQYHQIVREEVPFCDLLGDVYMELGSRGHRSLLGQFFTPSSISDMMSKMLIDKTHGQLKPDGDLWRTIDPACGSGQMMLSFARNLIEQFGPAALQYWSFSGIDLDRTCANMMAVQFLTNVAIHEITVGEIAVYCGNALGPISEVQAVLHVTHQAPDRNDAETVPALHPSRMAAIKEAVAQHWQQQGLFDHLEAA